MKKKEMCTPDSRRRSLSVAAGVDTLHPIDSRGEVATVMGHWIASEAPCTAAPRDHGTHTHISEYG